MPAHSELLPVRISGLADIANNMAWSWNREARALFKALDDHVWSRTRHNPVALLQRVTTDRLMQCAVDPAFLARYDSVMAWFRHETTTNDTWFTREHGEHRANVVAYFCAEFGIHSSVPIYSGGLGVLAGDHCKSASDLGVPLVGVGIMYREGYFDQRVGPEGWQEATNAIFDLDATPLIPLRGADGQEFLTVVRSADRDVHIKAWRLQVGRVPIYLLDTDLPENHPEDRPLLSRLYAGGPDHRLRQEWLLGVGGVRVLRALGIAPTVWHANEGHAAFMMLERVRELELRGISFADAIAQVRATTTFTTHTPVPAGHDMFAGDAVALCAGAFLDSFSVPRAEILALGQHPQIDHGTFHMTALAMRLARNVNAVSKRHGVVTRELWQSLWPDRPAEQLPIGHVTNGVHLATWMANSVMGLLDRTIGPEWGYLRDDESTWDRVMEMDDAALWQEHQQLKHVLLRLARESARTRFAAGQLEVSQLVSAGVLLDPQVFTIGFARRFATYKRADLVFHDPERLRAILTNPDRPVQLVFAGKAHPADTPGKHVLQRIYQFTRDPRFEGRVVFLEDYDMHLAHGLVQGVDLWLNLPRIPLEASGTSGMKAALNGVPQLSTVDGWWEEGFDGRNGWAIPAPATGEDADVATARRFYELLEHEVVPMYYDRNARGLSMRWIGVMKHAIRAAGLHFSGRRMMHDYLREHYVPAMRGHEGLDHPPTG
jgi:starch phosphorylase